MAFKVTTLKLSLPLNLGAVTITRTESQMKAAWALYVEFAARISTQPLLSGKGSVREALDSLYKLFAITLIVLINEGPSAAEGRESVGPLVINVLNTVLRPFLTEWRSSLSAFEAQFASLDTDSVSVNESQWEHYDEFFPALEFLRIGMVEFVDILARIAGIDD